MREDAAIRLASEGNEAALRRLYDDNCERIYQLAYRYTRSQEDAMDVVQETFTKAFKRIRSFRTGNDAGFSSWLSRICINCSIDQLRRRQREKMNLTIPLEHLATDPAAQNDSPDKRAELAETLRLITNAVAKLPPKQRIIFDLRHGQHHSIKEIADLMGCSESTVKTQLSRAVKKLRAPLAPLWGEQ